MVCASDGMWTYIPKDFGNLKFLKEGQPQTIPIFFVFFFSLKDLAVIISNFIYITFFPIPEIIYITIIQNEKRIIEGFEHKQ